LTVVKKASKEDYDAVIDITAKGFYDDPVMKWMLRSDDKYESALQLFMQTLAHMIYLPHRESYINDARTGATIWLPPGETGELSLLTQLRSVPTMIRIAGLTGIPSMLRVQSFLDKKHPTKPHYYLFSIASLPEMRGQGIGSSLMAPMTARFDEQQVGAYLENSRSANLPFYQRHGFEVTEQVQLPDGGPTMWLMWREPQKAGANSGTLA